MCKKVIKQLNITEYHVSYSNGGGVSYYFFHKKDIRISNHYNYFLYYRNKVTNIVLNDKKMLEIGGQTIDLNHKKLEVEKEINFDSISVINFLNSI